MDCEQVTGLSNSEYLAAFRKRIYEQRVPITGGINLLNRCNLKCVHCYVRAHGGDGRAETPTERILGIIDEATALGCLFFLITGGEPLLHRDFCSVYRHARRAGLMVSVFTNGTLLDESHVELFKELPPHYLEITLYGGSEPTFDRVTGVSGSFAACHAGIKRLRDAGISLRLKTMLLTLNAHELDAMARFAASVEAPFRFDPMVGPTLDGDLSPLRYRVSPEVAVAAEMADPERARKRIAYARTRPKPVRRESLYRCGAGATSFFVDAFGRLQPCLMVTDSTVDLLNHSFAEAWEEIEKVRSLKLPKHMPCPDCSDLPYCGYCPPVMRLENKMHVGADDYGCRLGRLRRESAEAGMGSPLKNETYEKDRE